MRFSREPVMVLVNPSVVLVQQNESSEHGEAQDIARLLFKKKFLVLGLNTRPQEAVVDNKIACWNDAFVLGPGCRNPGLQTPPIFHGYSQEVSAVHGFCVSSFQARDRCDVLQEGTFCGQYMLVCL